MTGFVQYSSRLPGLDRAHLSKLAALHLCLEQVKSGQGQVTLLCGEAGIGKSRLVKETRTAATAEGFLVLQASCFPTDRSCPYAPLLLLLRGLLITKVRARVLAELGPLAAAFFPYSPILASTIRACPTPRAGCGAGETSSIYALARVFTSQTSTQPVLLVVEDLHWSDDISLEFLHFLARQCVTHPLLLLCTYRSDEEHPQLRHLLAQLDRERLLHEYVLKRLSSVEVEAMVQAIFAEQQVVPGELREMLYTLTDGNPFFLEEVLKSLLMSGAITFTDRGWVRLLPSASPDRQFSIPRSVQDAVYQRTRHLSAQAKQVLTLAAVAGRRFDVEVLQHLLHGTEYQIVEQLQELITAQLVVEESPDQFSFRHALTRQAIYTGLLARQRRALHRRVANAIEQLFATPIALEAYLADLAYHCFHGEDWEKAREYGQRAGEKALTLFAPRAAVEHLTRAVEAASHLSEPPPTALYRARGQAYELLGQFERARADYEQALALAQEAQETSLQWQGFSDLGFLWASRDYIQAGQWFRRALELAQALADPRLQASSLNRLANWLVNTGHEEEGIHTHQQALQIFEAQHDKEGMAETLDLLGTANGFSGDVVMAVKQQGQAIERQADLLNEQAFAEIIMGFTWSPFGEIPCPGASAQGMQNCHRNWASAMDRSRLFSSGSHLRPDA